MGNWDSSTPKGIDRVNAVGSILREMKAALNEALSHEDSTFPGATPGSTPIFIPGMKTGTTAQRPTGDSLVNGRFYANTTLQIIERYNGASWDSVATNTPSGSFVAIFYNATAPVGWSAVAINDKFLRVVTADTTGGSTDGSVAASTSLAHTHIMADHTHAISIEGTHSHSIPSTASAGVRKSGGAYGVVSNAGSHSHTGATGAASASTTDSQLGAFAYADVIVASKD